MPDRPQFVSGLRASNDHGTDERPKNFREAILWLDPNGMTPITALSARMATESTDDPEFAWWEETLAPKMANVTGTSTGGGNTVHTTFTLSDPGPESAGVYADNPARQFKVGDLLQVLLPSGETPEYGADSAGETGGMEIVSVTGVTGDDTITVSRNYADSLTGGAPGTGVAVVSGTRLMYIGSAYAEGSGSPDAVFNYPQKNFNYTQIFKTSFELTETARQTNYRTGDMMANDRKRAMFKHAEGLEQACLWGVKHEFASGSEPIRLTSGLRAMLKSNINVNVGAVTDDFLLDNISPLFNWNAGGAGDQRIAFIGNSALNAFQKAYRDSNPLRMNYEGVVKFHGLKLLEFTLPQGTLFLKSHPLMNVDPIYSKSMFVINGKGLIRRPLRGRDTKIQTNIQANDADKRKDQWLTELGFELHFERTQGYFGNISF